MLGVHRTP